MHNKRTIILLLIIGFLMSSCSLYDKEMTVVSDYSLNYKTDITSGDKLTVYRADDLIPAINTIVEKYPEITTIVFDSGYEGIAHDDLSAACKKVIITNPLCAYCVESISFDLYQVLAYYEAGIYVSFAESAESIENIIRINYAGSLRDIIHNALLSGNKRIAVLINKSSYTEDYVRNIIEDIYYSDPLCLPKEPSSSVRMYTGSGSQRLYEIEFDYRVDDITLDSFQNDIEALKTDIDISYDMSQLNKVIYAVGYLISNCKYDESVSDCSAYDALISKKADCKGLALALNALCKILNVDCRIVYGQKNWSDHYWNIVRIDGDYYHIDVEACITDGIIKGFLLNDDSILRNYRWDLSSYPECNGSITYNINSFSRFVTEEYIYFPEQ